MRARGLLFAAILIGCASQPQRPPSPVAGPSCFRPGAGELRSSAPPGNLDMAEIRAVIRAHLSDVKVCYEAGLLQQPRSGGRVVVQFVVSPEGVVLASRLAESTVAFPGVDECIARAFCAWRFPPPRGGEAMATYPFTLTPAAPR